MQGEQLYCTTPTSIHHSVYVAVCVLYYHIQTTRINSTRNCIFVPGLMTLIHCANLWLRQTQK